MQKGFKGLILVLTLVFSLTIFVPGANAGLTIKYGYFPDVSDSHWAKQVITKMQLRDVVSGYDENGINYFKPDKAVTQMEAVIMAMRTTGLSDQEQFADSGKYLPFTVPDWAKKAAVVAVDEGLIKGDSFTWNKEASRAWVTQLLIRMIDKEDELAEAKGSFLPYTDSYTIPVEYIDYVKLANKLDLVKGNADNTFAPKTSVTRAQMVAFLSRTEKYLDLKDASVIIGQVTSATGNNISIRSADSTEYTVVYNSSSNLYGSSGHVVTGTGIHSDDWVYAIVDGTTVKYLEVTEEPDTPQLKLTTTEGTVLSVYPEESSIVAKTDSDKIETFKVTGTTKITNDANKRVITLDEIGKNSQVKLAFTSDGKLASIVLLDDEGVVSDADGVIYDIDFDTDLITIKKRGSLVAYTFNDDTDVTIGKNRLADMSDFKVGDQVSVKAKDSILDEITLVAEDVEATTEGVVKQVSIENRILTYKEQNGNLEANYIDSNVEIKFGEDAGNLEDIRVGDNVKVKIDEGKVVGISVTNRKLFEKMSGMVVSNDFSNRVITIKDSNGDLQAYVVADNDDCDILVNDEGASLNEIDKDMRVEIELTDGKITYLSAKNTVEGTVTRVSEDSDLIEVRLENGDRQRYKTTSKVDINIEDVSGADLDDIYVGDRVEIRVVGDKATRINVYKTKTVKVIKTYNSTTKVKVIDQENDTDYLYIYSRIDFTIPGVKRPDASDLNTGDILKVTYCGHSTIEKVEKVPTVLGTVTNVSNINNEITVRSFLGTEHEYEFTSDCKVNSKGRTLTTLGSISTGDRIAVEENLDGGQTFNLLSKISGKLGSIYEDRSRIYLIQTNNYWKQYDMDTTAYLHQGTKELSRNDFNKNDLVDIYLSNDEVFEVEKR